MHLVNFLGIRGVLGLKVSLPLNLDVEAHTHTRGMMVLGVGAPRQKRSHRSLLRLCHVRPHRKAAVYQPGRGSSPGAHPGATLISDLAAP